MSNSDLIRCSKCGKDVSFVTKMGGLICSLCRTILYLPDTEQFKREMFKGEK